MLKLQDKVFAKVGDKTFSADYTKVYFSHTDGDKVKTVTKQFDGKDAGTAIVPDGPSTAPVSTLYNEMVDYIAANFGGSAEKPIDPQSVILGYIEKGLDLSVRAAEGSALRPREVDVNKVIERQAKGFVQLGVYANVAEATAAIKAAMAGKAAA